MSITNIKKQHIKQVTGTLLVILFTFTSLLPVDIASALSPWAGSQRISIRQKMLDQALELSKVIYPEKGDNILDGRKAALLSHGKIMLSPELKDDPLAQLKAIFHEEVEAVMQILHDDDPGEYNDLKDAILSNSNIVSAYAEISDVGHMKGIGYDLLFNDIIARAFEYILLMRAGAISEYREMTVPERNFIDLIKPYIDAKGHNFFTAIFWDQYVREMHIRTALANGMDFYEVSNRPVVSNDPMIEYDLWEHRGVPELKNDLAENGLENFIEIDEGDVPAAILRSSQFGGVYRHIPTGLEIILKVGFEGIHEHLKSFCETQPEGLCPSFHDTHDDSIYYELNLVPMGYMPIMRIPVTRDVRRKVREEIKKTMVQGRYRFLHRDLNPNNILVKLGEDLEVLDVKIIDIEKISRLDMSKIDEDAAILEMPVLEGFDLSAREYEAVDLAEKSFYWTDLSGSIFRNVDLFGAFFYAVDLEDTVFISSDLRFSHFLNVFNDNKPVFIRAKFSEDWREFFINEGYGVVDKGSYCEVTSPIEDIKAASERLNKPELMDELAAGDEAESAAGRDTNGKVTLKEIIEPQSVSYGAYESISGGMYYAPTPYDVIVEIFNDLSGTFGSLRGKKLLDMGAGKDLRVSLIAENVFGMKPTAVEQDAPIHASAAKMYQKAKVNGFADGLEFISKPVNAFSLPWTDKDLVFYFYTQPSDPDGKDFRKAFEEKARELADDAIIVILFTEWQVRLADRHKFDGLKPLLSEPEEIEYMAEGFHERYFYQVYRPAAIYGTKDKKTRQGPFEESGTVRFSCTNKEYHNILDKCLPLAKKIKMGTSLDVEVADLAYMMSEAVKNAFVHASMEGKKPDENKQVVLKCEISDKNIKIFVEDEGEEEFYPDDFTNMGFVQHFWRDVLAVWPKMIVYFTVGILFEDTLPLIRRKYGLGIAVYQMGRYFDLVKYFPVYENGKKTGGTLSLELGQSAKSDIAEVDHISPPVDAQPEGEPGISLLKGLPVIENFTGDFEFVEFLHHGAFRIAKYKFIKENRKLSNGTVLQKDNFYVVKSSSSKDPDESEHYYDIFLATQPDFFKDVNPGNDDPHLPGLIGFADIGKAGTSPSGKALVFDHIDGVDGKGFATGLLTEPFEEKEKALLEFALEAFKGYRSVYYANGYVNGDIDPTAMRAVDHGNGDIRVIFTDNDTVTRQGASDGIACEKRLYTKPNFLNPDRKERFLEDGTPVSDMCLVRDDVYSLCESLKYMIMAASGAGTEEDWQLKLHGQMREIYSLMDKYSLLSAADVDGGMLLLEIINKLEDIKDIRIFKGTPAQLLTEMRQAGAFRSNPLNVKQMVRNAASRGKDNSTSTIYRELRVLRDVGYVEKQGPEYFLADWLKNIEEGMLPVYIDHYQLMSPLKKPAPSERDKEHIKRMPDFLEYLGREGLEHYKRLHGLFSPAVAVALLQNPDLRPVFLQHLPQEQIGPLQVSDISDVTDIDVRSLLNEHSVFLAGDADAATEILRHGGKISVGVTDRESSRSLMPNNHVANGRQAYFPLPDGTWLGVKGCGQFNHAHEAPFYFNDIAGMPSRWEGLAWEEEAEAALMAQETIGGDDSGFVRVLGYRKIFAAPDGRGGFISTVDNVDKERHFDGDNVLIFTRVLTPHRVMKIHSLLSEDPALRWLTWDLSLVLNRQGIVTGGRQLTPAELMTLIFARFGRQEARKQNRHICKYTLHVQDLNFAGEEADPGEACTFEEFAAYLGDRRRINNLDFIDLLIDRRLNVHGILEKIGVLLSMLEASSESLGYGERNRLFPRALTVLESLLNSYFRELNDRDLGVWLELDGNRESKAIRAILSGNDVSVLHPGYKRSCGVEVPDSIDKDVASREIKDWIYSLAQKEMQRRRSAEEGYIFLTDPEFRAVLFEGMLNLIAEIRRNNIKTVFVNGYSAKPVAALFTILWPQVYPDDPLPGVEYLQNSGQVGAGRFDRKKVIEEIAAIRNIEQLLDDPVLVMDDIMVTGKTLDATKGVLEGEFNAAKVYTASLLRGTKTHRSTGGYDRTYEVKRHLIPDFIGMTLTEEEMGPFVSNNWYLVRKWIQGETEDLEFSRRFERTEQQMETIFEQYLPHDLELLAEHLFKGFRSFRAVPSGTPATLLRYMRKNDIFNHNPKRSSEMARKRGGNDSLRTIQREIYALKKAGLVMGSPRRGYFLANWMKTMDMDEFIRQNPGLNKASPDEQDLVMRYNGDIITRENNKDVPFIEDFLNRFEPVDVVHEGLFVVVLYEYIGEDTLLANNVLLKKGNHYVLKDSRNMPDPRIRSFLQAEAYDLNRLNPDNEHPHLPVLAGKVDLSSTKDGERHTDGLLFNFIKGKDITGRIKDIRKLEGAAKDQALVELFLEVLKGYKRTYADNGYVHGDIDPTSVLISGEKGKIKRVIFVDNDTVTRKNSRSIMDRHRKMFVKNYYSSLDRDNRRDDDRTSTKDMCYTRDDVYSFCVSFFDGIESLHRKLPGKPRPVKTQIIKEVETALDYYQDAAQDPGIEGETLLNGIIAEFEQFKELLTSRQAFIEAGKAHDTEDNGARYFKGNPSELLIEMFEAGCFKDNPIDIAGMMKNAALRGEANSESTIYKELKVLKDVGYVQNTGSSYYLADWLGKLGTENIEVYIEHYPLMRLLKKPSPTERDKELISRQPEFLEYLEREGLSNYRILHAAFKPDVIEAVLDDPALVPVFVEAVPEEHLGPLVLSGADTVAGISTEEMLKNASVFRVGAAYVAEKLYLEGRKIAVGVTDRSSYRVLHADICNVANGRQVFFPLEDGTWIGIKGSGQMNDLENIPFGHDLEIGAPSRWDGLAFETWIKKNLGLIKTVNTEGESFVELLGYRKILAAPDGFGKFKDIAEVRDDIHDRSVPVLIFNRVLTPHRIVKFPQLSDHDPFLYKLSRRVSKALASTGKIEKGRDLNPAELMLYISGNFGRQEAVKQNLGVMKRSLHSQDLSFAGEEADNEEFCLPEDIDDQLERRLGPGIYKLFKEDGLMMNGLLTKVLSMSDIYETIRKQHHMDDVKVLFPDPDKIIEHIFRAYFAELDDKWLDIWTDGTVDELPLAAREAADKMELYYFKRQYEAPRRSGGMISRGEEGKLEISKKIFSWAREEFDARSAAASRTVYILPDSRDVRVGMGRDLYGSSAGAREIYNRAANAIGYDVDRLFMREEDFNDIEVRAACIVTYSVAICEMFRNEIPIRAGPMAVSGASAGEISAAVIAGSITLEDGMRIIKQGVQHYKHFMEEFDYGLLRVTGIGVGDIKDLLVPDKVDILFEGHDEVTLAVEKSVNVDKLIKKLRERGAHRAMYSPDPLVGKGIHIKYFEKHRSGPAEYIKGLNIKDPEVPVISAVNGSTLRSSQDIQDNLVELFYMPVRWRKVIEALGDIDPDTIIAFGPYRKLKRRSRAVAPGKEFIGIETPGEIISASEKLKAEFFAERLMEWALAAEEERESLAYKPKWSRDASKLGKEGVTFTSDVYLVLAEKVGNLSLVVTEENAPKMGALEKICFEAVLSAIDTGPDEKEWMYSIKTFYGEPREVNEKKTSRFSELIETLSANVNGEKELFLKIVEKYTDIREYIKAYCEYKGLSVHDNPLSPVMITTILQLADRSLEERIIEYKRLRSAEASAAFQSSPEPDNDKAAFPEDVAPESARAAFKDVVVTGSAAVDPRVFAGAAAKSVADRIIELQKDPGKLVNMIIATGNTQVEFLNTLAEDDRIDWRRMNLFHLDEYRVKDDSGDSRALASEDPSSFAYYIDKNLVSRVETRLGRELDPSQVHYIADYVNDGRGIGRYMADLEALGGADITMLGTGVEGHLGFNEKGSPFSTTMREVELSQSTIEANLPDYPGISRDPYAYTMGLQDIFAGRNIFFLAKGKRKSDIVAKALRERVTTDVPASGLQVHSEKVTVILDRDAAEGFLGTENDDKGDIPVEDPKEAFEEIIRDLRKTARTAYSDHFLEAARSFEQKKSGGESIIIYADDILDHAAAIDFEDAVQNVLSRNGVLAGGKIVLFSRDKAKALILEDIIKKANKSMGTLIVTENDLGLTDTLHKEADELEAITVFAKRKGVSRIMAAIKGPVNDPEILAKRCARLKMPVVMLGQEPGIYSFAEAVARAVKAKDAEGSEGWLVLLRPVRSIDEDMKALYEGYFATLQALVAA